MIPSPVGQLRAVIRQVAEAANTHRNALSQSEAFTRMALVDRVLVALGWDLTDSAKVRVEYSTQNVGRLDYALFGPSAPGVLDRPTAIIEAKKLGQPLEQNAHQVIAYALGARINSVFLTDGLVWWHYGSPLTTSPRVVDLSGHDPSEDAAYLITVLDAALFWPDQPEVDLAARLRELEERVQSLENRPPAETQPPPSPLPEEPAPAPRETARQAAPGARPLSSIEAKDVTHRKPASLTFPGRETQMVNSWKDFIPACVQHALDHGSRPLPVPFSTGPVRYLVNHQPTDRHGNEMRSPTRISTARGEFYVETHRSASESVRRVKELLEQAGAEEPMVLIRDKARRPERRRGADGARSGGLPDDHTMPAPGPG